MSTPAPQRGVVQNVTATAGFAYGVIGADIHVLGDGTPLYVLENYLRPGFVDPHWLRELPSRMLSARSAVVGFTGRESERDDLRGWSQAAPRLAARWLHAPGGQGKTRLAAQVAEELIDAGWKVITATHGPGAVLPPPGSQDMRLGEARGLLLIIDYADRWPLTHLAWLLSNALLHQTAVPTRVLPLARTAYAWPALREKLGSYQAGVSQQLLTSLPDEPGDRERAFIAARDSFAGHYGVADPGIIAVPVGLDRPEWGLILTLHMAALVAVDAHVHGRPSPRDPVGLTAYLLDRERAHWTHLYENRAQPDKQAAGLEFQTPPSVMSRAVFSAALTGPVSHLVGKAILNGLDLELPSDRVLTDHTACYPPANPRLATVLEPLYPDRLAEDFLGVTMPGHATDQPTYAWAPSTTTALLNRTGDHRTTVYAPRAITFLASAAERWPHLGETFLYPLLRHDPQLALDAGAAALTALASLPQVYLDVLEAIERLLPPERHVDLDPGIAAVIRRLTEHRLATTDEPGERAQLYLNLGRRLSNAGDHRQALQATEEAAEVYRDLAVASPQAFGPELAKSLTSLGMARLILGHREEALTATEEAVELLQRLRGESSSAFDAELATSLNNLGVMQTQLGRREEAVPTIEEAVRISRRLVAANPQAFGPDLAKSLANLGVAQSNLGRWEAALRTIEEAVKLFRPLAAANPEAFQPDLAILLGRLGNRMRYLGRRDEALAATEEALELHRRLAAANPAAFEPGLATSLGNLGSNLSALGRQEEALAATEEAVELCRRLAESSPGAFKHYLAASLDNFGSDLFQAGRWEEALAAIEEAVELCRQLAAANPFFEYDLATSLGNLGRHMSILGRREEALATIKESTELLRRLATANPTMFEPYLAGSLSHLGQAMSELGRQNEALAATEEAVRLCRRLVVSNPAAFEANLATALNPLGRAMADLGRQEEALAATQEAVDIFRGLAAVNPAAFESHLAQGLWSFARVRAAAGLELPQALAAVQESVAIYRRLVQVLSLPFADEIRGANSTLADVLQKLDRSQEATAIRLQTPGGDPSKANLR